MPLTTRILTTIAHGVSPSRDEALGASSCTGTGQRNGGHASIEGGRGAQLNQHNVIVNGVCIVLGVADDLGGVDELLTTLKDLNVVFSQTHLDAAKLK